MVASRSRNIRLCLVLQSYSQLQDIYGESKAATILSSVGVTIAFSTNNYNTLEELSQRCGNRTIYENGSRYTEPILTPNQIAAMPIATALILIRGRMKWVCKFPILKREIQPINLPVPKRNEDIKTFDLKKVVDNYKKAKRSELFGGNSNPFEKSSVSHISNEPIDSVDELTVDDLMKKIDERLAELEEDSEEDED